MDWMKLTEEQVLNLPAYECIMQLLMHKDQQSAVNDRIKYQNRLNEIRNINK